MKTKQFLAIALTLLMLAGCLPVCASAAYGDPVTIVFDANGGTGAPGSIVTAVGETFIVPTQAPTMDGFTFGGWVDMAWALNNYYGFHASYELPYEWLNSGPGVWPQPGDQTTVQRPSYPLTEEAIYKAAWFKNMTPGGEGTITTPRAANMVYTVNFAFTPTASGTYVFSSNRLIDLKDHTIVNIWNMKTKASNKIYYPDPKKPIVNLEQQLEAGTTYIISIDSGLFENVEVTAKFTLKAGGTPTDPAQPTNPTNPTDPTDPSGQSWWETLPGFVQWLLRWLCFGWIWMSYM